MKDSQRSESRDAGINKYIKANNERFSTRGLTMEGQT